MVGLQRASVLDINGTVLAGNAATIPTGIGETRSTSEMDGMGGGLWVSASLVQVAHLMLANNSAAYGGGMAWALTSLDLDGKRLASLDVATDEGLRGLLVCPTIAAATMDSEVLPNMDSVQFAQFQARYCSNVLSDFLSHDHIDRIGKGGGGGACGRQHSSRVEQG